MTEESKNHWLKVVVTIIITFIISFLAFYLAMELMFYKMTDPIYNARKIERMIHKQEKSFKNFEKELMENPFEPKMSSRIVNLIKENDVYRVIVDLKPIEGNENNVKVDYNDNILSINGELDKKVRGNEKIVNFSQAYLLDEKLDISKMTKEKKGDKYIITIPFEE